MEALMYPAAINAANAAIHVMTVWVQVRQQRPAIGQVLSTH
jgi:hypothetical protein